MARFGTRDGETSGSATVLGYYPQEAAFCDISDLHSSKYEVNSLQVFCAAETHCLDNEGSKNL